MANKQQTAVEWLFSQLPDHLRLSRDGFDMLQRAKAMEREQLLEAWKGAIRCTEEGGKSFEQVYGRKLK